MDKNKCPILKLQKNFYQFYYVFCMRLKNENIIIIFVLYAYMVIK